MRVWDIIFIILSLAVPGLMLIKPIIECRKSENKNFIKDYRYELIISIALAIGFLLRLYKTGVFPLGFNQDEASIGYDAWAIMNHGIDRNGIHLPVHLIAWGSGQNALYAYICMPFIKLFGLTEFAVRLPMAVIGCFSLLIMKKLLETIGTKKLAAIGVSLFAVMPWHIMKSRWGLESNLFPDLVLLAAMLMIIGANGRKWGFYTGSAVLGLSAYAYGTSYFFLPIFVLILFIYMLIQKKLKLWEAAASLGIIAVVSLPVILFVLINQFGWNAIETPLFTIPSLNETRQASILSLGGNIPKALWMNFKSSLKILVVQTDGLPWNSIRFFGTHYVLSLPFIPVGIYAMFKKRGYKPDFIFFAWLAAALMMTAIMSANINRINIIFLPAMYFIILGVYTVIEAIRHSWIPVTALFAVLAIIFSFTYFGSYQDTISYYFYNGLGPAIEYSELLSPSSVVVSNKINAPYIYMLFYTQTEPEEYIATVKMLNEGGAFEWVNAYGKYSFAAVNPQSVDPSSVYIVENGTAETMRELYPDCCIMTFSFYSVVSFN